MGWVRNLTEEKMGKQRPRKRGWRLLAQLLFDPSVKRLLSAAVIIFVLIPKCVAFSAINGDHLALAAETTAWLFLNPGFGPRNVLLSESLHTLGQNEGISDYDLKAIIAAAALETTREIYPIYPEWQEKTWQLAAHLLGLAKVESGYCRNLGAGLAYNEVQKRLSASSESERGWWQSNLNALEEIADQLGIPVESIPGSIGAGAISCFQLMPSSWLHYGGGDFRNTYQAALNAVHFLKAHGYDEDPARAIRYYNFNAGQSYVDAVLSASTIWQEPVKTALILMPVPLNVLTLAMTFFETLAWYMNEFGIAIGVAGEFVNPYPGSHVCGNPFGLRMSPIYTHWGVDLCGGSSVYAMHDGTVVFSGFITTSDPRAWNESDPDYYSASGYVVVLEASLPDGRSIQSIYAHLQRHTIPPVGAPFAAGDYIGETGCSGRPDELCSGKHLHLGVKIDGQFGVNPVELFSGGGQ